MPNLTASPELSERFRRQGAMIMTVFALPWAVTGIGVLGDGLAYWQALAVSVLITVALAVYSVRHRPRHTRERNVPSDWLKRYNIAVAVELVLIAVTVTTLILVQLPALVPAVVCVIVGVHFFPLATAFDQPQYRITGAALTVAGIVGAVVFAVADPALCGLLAGLGAAVTLWWTSLVVTRAG